MAKWFENVTLEGRYVLVEPLSMRHNDDLVEAVNDGNLHELWYTTVPSPEAMADDIERRLNLSSMLPFSVIEKASGKAIGMTTYMNIDANYRKLEIGSTWYRKSAQKTPINTESKLLLLSHAFEELDCICVEFRTHYLNIQSRKAIERLGAKLDGILRSNMIMPNGTIRDTAVYSIIASEWPTVKANLTWRFSQSQ
ncbi:MAG: GNAT family protein [Pseudomonadota bacterium]